MCALDCACTHVCVMCVVMNKDVLCVELVVNHWQCWQLTDKQIDPRPPRERRLALAHSSHTHAPHTHTHTVHMWTQSLSEGRPKVLSSGSSLTIHVNICESYSSTQWATKKAQRGNGRRGVEPDSPDNNFNSSMTAHLWIPTWHLLLSRRTHTQIHTNTHLWLSRNPPGDKRRLQREGKNGRMDGWIVGGKTGWQDDKTVLRKRSSTMWQLGRPTRDWGSQEEDGKINREKNARRRKQEVKHLWFLYGFQNMVSGGEVEIGGGCSPPVRAHFTYLMYKKKLLSEQTKADKLFFNAAVNIWGTCRQL